MDYLKRKIDACTENDAVFEIGEVEEYVDGVLVTVQVPDEVVIRNQVSIKEQIIRYTLLLLEQKKN